MLHLLSRIFRRMTVVLALILIQLAVVVVVLVLFSQYFAYFYYACLAVSIFAVIRIVNKDYEPGYKIAWIIPILVFPIFGGLLYFMLGGNKMTRSSRRKLQGMDTKMEELLRPDFKADALACNGEDAVLQARYLERYAHAPAYANTVTEYFPLGDTLFPKLLEELRAAKHYIFLEYFIIAPGVFWSAVLEVLEQKVAEGVEVRLIYDDMGCVYTLPHNYVSVLEKKGIRTMAFNRFIPVLSLRLNNRDHRKLCVIDGHTAFTGGINLADEYINQKVRFGHWKDSAIMLKGDAAWSMAVMFLTMWDYNSDGEEEYARYRPRETPPEVMAAGQKEFVQPYTDVPLDDEAVGETVYLNLIAKARKYIYFTTPYLILSNAMYTAFCTAAKAGVDVRIITPHIPDKKFVFELTRSQYLRLLVAGVKIYEYTPGFIHAKNSVVDDCYGTVGTVNLDYRSLFLHFENGVLLYHSPTLLDVKRDFLETLPRCEEITEEKCRNIPWHLRAWRAFLRIFAPLL